MLKSDLKLFGAIFYNFSNSFLKKSAYGAPKFDFSESCPWLYRPYHIQIWVSFSWASKFYSMFPPLNQILMPMKKIPKSGCDKVYRVRNSFQKNQISAHRRQIFSKNYQILAIFAVFCNFRILFGTFSQIKAKIRVCREKLIIIDPKNVKIGPLGPIFENRSNWLQRSYLTVSISTASLCRRRLRTRSRHFREPNLPNPWTDFNVFWVYFH